MEMHQQATRRAAEMRHHAQEAADPLQRLQEMQRRQQQQQRQWLEMQHAQHQQRKRLVDMEKAAYLAGQRRRQQVAQGPAQPAWQRSQFLKDVPSHQSDRKNPPVPRRVQDPPRLRRVSVQPKTLVPIKEEQKGCAEVVGLLFLCLCLGACVSHLVVPLLM
jgi:hypothetical protein